MIRFMSVKICTTSRRSPCLFSLFTYIHYQTISDHLCTINTQETHATLCAYLHNGAILDAVVVYVDPASVKLHTPRKRRLWWKVVLYRIWNREKRELTVDHKCVHQDCQNQDQSKASKLSALSLPNNLWFLYYNLGQLIQEMKEKVTDPLYKPADTERCSIHRYDFVYKRNRLG